jgi:hypothetical protein
LDSVDVALLEIELKTQYLSLATAQDLLYGFHRATLLLYLQLLAKAMQRLDARSAESIHRFKRRIRAGLEAF